jgi:porphobilinogen deaminase
VLDRPLKEIGGKGLFTREIEEACWPAASTSRCTR